MLRHYQSTIRENIHMQCLYATDLLTLTFYKIIKCWFGLVWFIYSSFIHICNIGHINYRLQFTTQLIINGHPHNTM